MASYIDSLSVLESSYDVAEILSLLRKLFNQHGLIFVPDTHVILHDHRSHEHEPEVVSSENEALKIIGSWPALGGTQYVFGKHMLSVFLYGTEDFKVDVITTSTASSPYVMEPQFKVHYDLLVTAIHNSVKAIRTIADRELLSPDSFWKEELVRVRENIFLGTYGMDLR
jgi:hypothetical protein